MKKTLSLLLSILLIFSVMAPITAFAENGPHPTTIDKVGTGNADFSTTQFSAIGLIDIETFDMCLVYPETEEMPVPDELKSYVNYDIETNTLTLKDAEFAMPLRILGSANIVLEGENKIECAQAPALQCDLNQNFSGSGKLTLICADYFAINCKNTPVFGDGVTVTASTEADGSNPVAYSPIDATTYKWVEIQGNDEPDGGDEEPELTFWQKIVNFFKKIFDVLFGWIG